MWNNVQIGRLLVFHSFLLILHADATQETNGNNCTDDTQHAERIGTGIAVGNGRGTGSEDLIAGLRCRTKSGSVGYGTTEYADHHGKIAGIIFRRGSAIIKDKEIQAYATQDVEQDDAHSHQVQLDASLLETLEETRPHLQTDAIDKQDETKVLHERQDIVCSGKAKMAGHNTRKKHECDS